MSGEPFTLVLDTAVNCDTATEVVSYIPMGRSSGLTAVSGQPRQVVKIAPRDCSVVVTEVFAYTTVQPVLQLRGTTADGTNLVLATMTGDQLVTTTAVGSEFSFRTFPDVTLSSGAVVNYGAGAEISLENDAASKPSTLHNINLYVLTPETGGSTTGAVKLIVRGRKD